MGPDDVIATLARAPLLGLLEREALAALAAGGEVRRLRPDEILFRAGERSDGGYVVLSGELAVARDRTGAMALAGPGALVGRHALFVRAARPAAAVARGPTAVIRISPTLLRRVLDRFPGAAAAVADALADDLDELSGELERVRAKLNAIEGR